MKKQEVRNSLFDGMNQPTTLGEVKKKWASCTKCADLAECRKQVVFWDGKQGATLMIVGQWPGKGEDEHGVPFQGAAGQLCRELIHQTKGMLYSNPIPINDVIWTNVLGCRLSDDAPFAMQYMKNCSDRLESEIALLRPRMLVAMGRVAIMRLAPPSAKIHQLRGTRGTYKGRPTVYIGHPAILNRLRDRREREQAQAIITEEINLVHTTYKEIRDDEIRRGRP